MKDMLHSPPNEAPVNEVWAFLSVDDKGNEGIIAGVLKDVGTVMLATGKRSMLVYYRPIALQIGKMAGVKVRLVRYARAETEEEYP
jgi:hypothetical protein